MNDSLNFIEALFGSTSGAFEFVHKSGANESVVTVEAPNEEYLRDFIESHSDDLSISPTVGTEAFFVFKVEDMTAGSLEHIELKPTAIVRRDTQTIVCWAFDASVSCSDLRLQALVDALGMLAADEAIPVPPTAGWTLVQSDKSAVYALEALCTFMNATVIEPHAAKHFAADIFGTFNRDDYDKEVVVTFGTRSDQKRWAPKSIKVNTLLDVLCSHRSGGKNGSCAVFADIAPGPRIKNAVKAIYGVGLDLDTGTPRDVVDAKLKAFGHLAVRYSTHSSYKTSSDFKKGKVEKWLAGRPLNEQTLQLYLREVEAWDEAVATSAKMTGTERSGQGFVVRVTHAPLAKHRIVILFKEPFVIEAEANSDAEAAEKWARVPKAIAERLGVPFDKSCTDLCRLFYLARHDEGQRFDASLFTGPYFDWRELFLEDDSVERLAKEVQSGKSKSVTEAGRNLGGWFKRCGHGFMIADVIEAYAPDRIRNRPGHGLEIECPFDAHHSNSDDPEDRACFAVNAGEGHSDWFVVSCRHEGCRDKTMLDMLGRMLTNAWFEPSVLEDPDFNCAVDADLRPEAHIVVSRDEVKAALEKLEKRSTPTQIEEVLLLALNAGFSELERADVVKAVDARTGTGRRVLNAALKRLGAISPVADVQRTVDSVALAENLSASLGRTFVMPPKVMGDFSLKVVEGQIWLGRGQGDEFQRLCSPIDIDGGVNYEDRDFARALRVEVLHPDGRWVPIDIEAKDLASVKGTPVLEKLLEAGFSISPAGRDFLLEYLMTARPRGRTVYHRPGFRDQCFICPTGEVLLAEPGNVELAKEMRLTCQARAGSFEGWKSAINGMFAVEAAYRHQAGVLIGLVGTLCDLAGDLPCAFTLEGDSTSGKSTSQGLAAGHWANPKIGEGLFLRAKGTENSQEIPLERGSGTLTALDEIGEMPAKAQHELMFMNQAGTAKRRMTQRGQAQRTRTWGGSVLVVSAETGFAQRLKSERFSRTGGLSVRVVPIAYEVGARLSESEYAFAESALANYGWSGPAFVHALADQGYVSNRSKLHDEVDELWSRLPETQGTENAFRRRAARPVAYMWMAGLIAARAGIIPVTFDYEALATQIWRGALASDIGPTEPAEQAVSMMLEAIISRRGHDIVPLAEKTNAYREVLGYFGEAPDGQEVYVLRSGRISELYEGITVSDRSVRKLLNKMGLVARPKDSDSLTWSGFPGLGKGAQYLVLLAGLIDSPDPEVDPLP